MVVCPYSVDSKVYCINANKFCPLPLAPTICVELHSSVSFLLCLMPFDLLPKTP